MQDHDEFEEPCPLGNEDHAETLNKRPSPPAGMTWWEGRWPAGGVNSLDDLTWWVGVGLEEMISLQNNDTLADIGRMLGIQTLKNADRYLGQFGKGDHPPRPSADQLQRVEDVEDALEAVLRHLRQQGQPADTDASQPTPSVTAKGESPEPLLSWTQPKLDMAIREYIAHRAGALKSLTEAVQANRKGAVESARAMFGRGVIARALRVKSRTMVTNSAPWNEVADDLRLHPDKRRRLKPTDKIGFDIAAEERAVAAADPVADVVERRDAIRLVRKKLQGERADAIVDGLELGSISPEGAEEMVSMILGDKDDNRPRRKPR